MRIGLLNAGLFAVMMIAASSLQAADAQKGLPLYMGKCAMCHAKDLKGNAAMAKALKADPAKLDLTSKETQAKTDADLIAITTKGKDKMPAQGARLKAEEIADIIAYVRSVGGAGAEKAK